MSEREPFDKDDHDEHCPHHSGKRGHYCPEWDELYICEDCPEFESCVCKFEESDQ